MTDGVTLEGLAAVAKAAEPAAARASQLELLRRIEDEETTYFQGCVMLRGVLKDTLRELHELAQQMKLERALQCVLLEVKLQEAIKLPVKACATGKPSLAERAFEAWMKRYGGGLWTGLPLPTKACWGSLASEVWLSALADISGILERELAGNVTKEDLVKKIDELMRREAP